MWASMHVCQSGVAKENNEDSFIRGSNLIFPEIEFCSKTSYHADKLFEVSVLPVRTPVYTFLWVRSKQTASCWIATKTTVVCTKFIDETAIFYRQKRAEEEHNKNDPLTALKLSLNRPNPLHCFSKTILKHFKSNKAIFWCQNRNDAAQTDHVNRLN